MRCVREILRLKAAGLRDRAIVPRTRVARSTVSEYTSRAVAAGLRWPLLEEVTDSALEALLFVRGGPRWERDASRSPTGRGCIAICAGPA